MGDVSTSSSQRLAELRTRIGNRTATLGVVGLGYVGLPVALSFAQAGFEVIGVDRQRNRIDKLIAGDNPIRGYEPGLGALVKEAVISGRFKATTDYKELGSADVITINVDTPVDDDRQPRYQSLADASTSIGQVIGPGRLVIVESTVSPGTTDRLVIPTLVENSGLKLNVDLFVGACPERVMPGRLLQNIRTVPRTCGGSSPAVAELMRSLYHTVVEADLDATDVLTAELVKVTENAYRDVQIAFANEISMLCDELGIDVWKIRDLVNKVPYRDMHRPGGGVGGHCLPKDSWLLAAASSRSPLRLIPAARTVNDSMPLHVANEVAARIKEWQSRAGREEQTWIAVLGYSYLPESDDIRNTPSEQLVDELRQQGFRVRIHDPFVDGYNYSVSEAVDGCVAVIVMVPHKDYDELRLTAPIVVRVGRRA